MYIKKSSRPLLHVKGRKDFLRGTTLILSAKPNSRLNLLITDSSGPAYLYFRGAASGGLSSVAFTGSQLPPALWKTNYGLLSLALLFTK